MRSLLFVMLLLCGAAHAAEIVDATGRTVPVPDHIARILPAGPPAAVLLAPPGEGTFRPVTLAQIALLDPEELLFADARMRGVVEASDAWRAQRAVRTGHAFIVPALPFGWVAEPPSLNRLLGAAWLGGHEAAALTASFGAVVYGRTPATGELAAVTEETRPLPP